MRRRLPDLRTPFLALFGWAGALAGAVHGTTWPVAIAAIIALAGVATWRWRGRPAGLAFTAGLLVFVGAATAAGVRYERVAHNPLTELAATRSSVLLIGVVSDDPRLIRGRFADEVLVRLQAHEVVSGQHAVALREPVLVFASTSWLDVPLGSTVGVSGHLGEPADPDVAAVLSTSASPDIRAGPGPWWRASARMRAAVRASVSGLPDDRRALVPALVDGDDAGLDPALGDDFKATGLTHLLAVSGTNLTLVVGFALVVARWCRVRGRWLYVVGAAGIVGFVLLARTEPSVLRAAAMGSVALVGMASNGTDRGLRALGVATIVLLLVDPMLASAEGFALSVLATAGILLLAPSWRDAMSRWMPHWLAEAIAVPAAAQLACTPLVAAFAGQVSLVAVTANLLAAPVVGPATVLGLLGGIASLVWPLAGRVFGWAAGWCVAWVIEVAHRGASLPTASVSWGSGAVALTGLTVLCLAIALVAPRVLGRRGTGLACCLLMVVVALVRVPRPGWPPEGWLMVACDVGQGDGLVLATGVAHQAVVVDAGPDPRPMDRCLDELGVRRVPLVVLTHFHADHVDGLPGVFDGRHVDAMWVTRLQDPPEGVDLVRRVTTAAGLRPVPAPYAEASTIGSLVLEPLWPLPDSPTRGPGDGSTANNASVVMLARLRGVTLFLGGDIEPEGQAQVATAFPGLHADVLKVPHHGSRYQDLPFLESLGTRLAVISVGADNDYGHPAPETVDALESTGETVLRTDRDGDIAIVERNGRLSAVTSK